MGSVALAVLLVAYLPGAVLFRLPIAQRERRSRLPIEERLFWAVVLSVALTSIVVLCLAAVSSYRFERLLWVNGGLSIGMALAARGRLRLEPAAPGPGWTTAVAAGLTAFAALIVFWVPPSEYVMGGKDPGTYFNQGIQIAQRGTLTLHDPLVASMPRELLDLWAPERRFETYYGNRFMGFYLVEPSEGTVRGQFPHLLPSWIAIGYGAHGLTGARYITGLAAVLGIIAVYFCGTWMLGWPAAAAGTILLILNVVTVWYSRYPNAEILLQSLAFAGLLAFSRSSVDGDRFFAPVAAGLLTLGFFAHLTGILIIATVFVAAILGVFVRRPPQLSFLLPLALGTLTATVYYTTLMAPYIERQLQFVLNRLPPAVPVVGVALLALLVVLSRTRVAALIRTWVPWGMLAVVLVLASYAYFLRVPGGTLSPYDAEALRTFAGFYVLPLGLVAALAGVAVLASSGFWRNLAFVATVLVFSGLFFYKTRIIPEHFWAARRWLAVILPGTCLLIGTAALGGLRLPGSVGRIARVGFVSLGILLVGYLGVRYGQATRPILDHVEYAGLVPQLEALDEELRDTDLLLVESRQISDLHTLALPLSYIYAHDVLIFWRRRVDTVAFRDFLSWARGRYERVLFLGGSGSGVPSRSMTAVPLFVDRFEIPEYESAYRAYPTEVRQKAYDFGMYELVPRLDTPTEFELDVGAADDLYVQEFYAKETMTGTDVTFRWSSDESAVFMPAVTRDTVALTVWLNLGGRPPHAEPIQVDVYLNDTYLGGAAPTTVFQPYRFALPPSLTASIAEGEDAALLRIRSTTWNPGDALGANDTRDLGVMVDRVTVE